MTGKTLVEKAGVEYRSAAANPIEELAEMVRMDPEAYKVQCKSVAKASAGRDLTASEFDYFMSIAAKYKLNPLGKGEIYAFQKRGGGLQIIVGVDGWISIANRHPDWGGMGTPEYYGEGDDLTCVVPIYRKSMEHPFRVPVMLKEFYMEKNPNWQVRPRWMMFIRSFNMAVRFAFGITDIIDSDDADRWEGMGLVDRRPAISEPREIEPEPEVTEGGEIRVISDAQRRRLFSIADMSGVSKDEIKAKIKSMGFESTKEITVDVYDALCDWADGKAVKP